MKPASRLLLTAVGLTAPHWGGVSSSEAIFLCYCLRVFPVDCRSDSGVLGAGGATRGTGDGLKVGLCLSEEESGALRNNYRAYPICNSDMCDLGKQIDSALEAQGPDGKLVPFVLKAFPEAALPDSGLHA